MVTNIFGNIQKATGLEVFSLDAASGVNNNQLLQKSLKRDLDKIQGYKVDITPADAKRLAKIQDEITRLQARAGPGGLSIDQFNDRAALYREANDILGKEYVDVSADPILEKLVTQIDVLLEPVHRGATKTRLENLRKLEGRLFEGFYRGNTSKTQAQRIANVQAQINTLIQPRKISELSGSERRNYNTLVELANDRAGFEYLLNANKREKAEAIQKSIIQLG